MSCINFHLSETMEFPTRMAEEKEKDEVETKKEKRRERAREKQRTKRDKEG